MEVKYTVKEKLPSSDLGLASLSYKGTCAVSCQNIIAYTRANYHPNPTRHNIPVFSVYVADVNTPYESHMIMECPDQIKNLVFDTKGQQLLVVMAGGGIRVYIKGSALNSWTNTFSTKWPGEDILHAQFFYVHHKPMIQKTDGRGSIPYLEKFLKRQHRPSLCNIGGCPQNGFFVVTASGLIFTLALDDTGGLEQESSALLGRIRDNFFKAASSWSPSGDIHIATWKPDLVRVWKVSLKYTNQERTAESKSGLDALKVLEVEVNSTQSFVPSLNAFEKHESVEVVVSHMLYPEPEDPDNLLVCLEIDRSRSSTSETRSEKSGDQPKTEAASVTTGSVITNYRLIEKQREITRFLPSTSPGDNDPIICKEKVWTAQTEWISPIHRVTSIAVPDQITGGSLAPYVITVATSNGSLYCLTKEKMVVVYKTSLPNVRQDDMPPPKRPRVERYAVSMCPTWTALHLLALDTEGSLHLSSLLKQSDIGTCWPLYIMLLFEYALVSGRDWLDILMAMPLTSAITLAECASETLYQHPAQLVQHLGTRFLVMKHSLVRLTQNLHFKSIEARIQAHLSAIVKMFRCFRPVTMDSNSESESTPVFQAFVENRSSLDTLDVDKALDQIFYTSNILDCQADPALLQDLQFALQFTADLSLYLLLLMVQNPKYELVKDLKILTFLREILLTSRAWYRHRQLVFPQMLRKSDSVDVWATLYRLLTKLAHILPNELDTAFIDECVLLETQVTCREMPLFIPPRGILGCLSSILQSPFPLQFTQDQSDPNSSVTNVNPRPLEGCIQVSHPFDPLNNMYIGGSGSYLLCTRCFSPRAHGMGEGEFSSMWEQEWGSTCLCGGHWAPSPTYQPSRPA